MLTPMKRSTFRIPASCMNVNSVDNSMKIYGIMKLVNLVDNEELEACAMLQVGDLVNYASQGVCRIVDITEKTVAGVSRPYYVMQPIDDTQLTISIPVDPEKEDQLKIVSKEKAEEIIDSFKTPGIEWIEKNNQRYQRYMEICKSQNKEAIADVANTLMRRKHELESNGKKFGNQDEKLLTLIQQVLFPELAIALDTTYEDICERVESAIQSA